MGPDLPPADLDLEERPAGARPAGAAREAEPPAPAAAPATAARRDGVATAAAAGHALTLAAAAPLILWFNRNQWFFGDEWEFFANRTMGWGRVLFEPHNEHWSTVPILVYRAVSAAAGVRTYVPYVAVLVVVHLVATHLLWRVMGRAGVAPLVATALAAVFAVLGSGAENLLWAFQIGFVGSVALGLLQVLLVDHPGPFGRRDRLAWAVATAGLLCSGIGVTMTAVGGLVVLLRRDLKAAVATVAVPAAVYVVWLAVVGRSGLDGSGLTAEAVLDTPAYLWTGLTSALERVIGVPGAGSVLLVLLVGWLLWRRMVVGKPAPTATAMAVGAALVFVVVGVGRAGLGLEQATSGRYVYVSAALFLPALGLVLSQSTRGLVSRQLVAAGLLVPVLLHNVDLLGDESHAEAERERPIRGQLLAAADLVQGDAELVGAQPEPRFSPDVTVDVLRRLRRDGALPGGGFGEADLLTAAGYLQVAPLDRPPVTAAAAPPATSAPVDGRGCLLVGPLGAAPVDVEFLVPAFVSVRSSGGGEVTLALRSPARPGVSGRPRTVALAAGATTWLYVTRLGTFVLSGPGPAVEVCGLAGR